MFLRIDHDGFDCPSSLVAFFFSFLFYCWIGFSLSYICLSLSPLYHLHTTTFTYHAIFKIVWESIIYTILYFNSFKISLLFLNYILSSFFDLFIAYVPPIFTVSFILSLHYHRTTATPPISFSLVYDDRCRWFNFPNTRSRRKTCDCSH